ncbi:MAG: F-box protein [Legionella longbeachae]|nr:F-box protein [Legionella longbeachae]
MQVKQFSDLPTVLKCKIFQDLPTPDLLTFIRTSKVNIGLFKSDTKYLNSLLVNRFLHHVVRGEYAMVGSLLALHPDLIDMQGQVTDLSKRSFPKVSGFEYALWALDKHMWTKMLECLPKDEKGARIKARLYGLLNQFKERGVTYTLNGNTITEKHFDFNKIIIKALKAYVLNPTQEKWLKVGAKQRLLPAHAVDEYCSNEPFFPIPKFTQRPKSSKQFTNRLTGEKVFWFATDSELGESIAVYKGAWGAGCGGMPHTLGGGGQFDLAALQLLFANRTNDLISLEDSLRPTHLINSQKKHKKCVIF